MPWSFSNRGHFPTNAIRITLDRGDLTDTTLRSLAEPIALDLERVLRHSTQLLLAILEDLRT